MRKLFLDFETFFSVACSLRKLSTTQYIRHPEFLVWGVGVQWEDEEHATWITGSDCESYLDEIDWDDTALVCHNSLFDAQVLRLVYGHVAAYNYCTASMSRGVWPTSSASLKNTAERCFPGDDTMRKGEELIQAKGISDLPPDIEEAIAGYCRQDVALTKAIFDKIYPHFPEPEFNLIDMTIRMAVEPSLALDRERLQSHLDEITAKNQQVIEDSGTTREVLASNPKFTALIESMNIVVPTKVSPNTGKTIPAFGKADKGWQQLRAKYPEHENLWSARVTAKSRIDETRAQAFLDAADPETNLLPVPLRYYGAHTGRFSGTDGLNLQNLPRGSELRKALIAPHDQSLIYVADLSNIESRMLAWLANEDELLHSYRHGVDLYCEFASQIYDREITKADATERFVGKTCILGLGYGVGHKKLRETLASGAQGPVVELSDSEARAIVQLYRNMYWRIPALWSQLENLTASMVTHNHEPTPYSCLVFQNQSVKLPNELALRYPNLHIKQGQLAYETSKGTEYTYGGRLTENIVQALSRIIITDAMLVIEQEIPDSRVALTVHDEVVVVAPAISPGYTLDSIIKILCRNPEWAKELPLAAEGGYADNYSK